MVAHPADRLFRFANDRAEVSSRKIPPICPLTSLATQKPSMLRPMKKCGDRLADYAGVERLKLRGDPRRFVSRPASGVRLFLLALSGRRALRASRKVWAH